MKKKPKTGILQRFFKIICLAVTLTSAGFLIYHMVYNQNALLFIRGERPILDAKYDLMKHPNIRYTEDGGAGPFNYAKAPLAHDDFTFDETRYDDYELLLDEDIIGELF